MAPDFDDVETSFITVANFCAFLFLEPTILLACDRDRELWLGPTPEVPDSRTSRQIWQIWLVEIRNEYSAHTQKIGSGQSSRSLPQARRILGSGNENKICAENIFQKV